MSGNTGRNSQPKTDHLNPWKPGQSGNPSGRPKIPEEVKEILRAATPKAAQVLLEILHNPEEPSKLRAEVADKILDRVYGKAAQAIDVTTDGQPINFPLLFADWDNVKTDE